MVLVTSLQVVKEVPCLKTIIMTFPCMCVIHDQIASFGNTYVYIVYKISEVAGFVA